MKKTILTWIGMMIFLVSLPSYTGAENQASILKMEELKVQVMPEYANHPKDKEKSHPSLLIGYHGTLINPTDRPVKGEIEIPLPMDEDEFRIGFVADYNRDLTELNEIEYEMDKKNRTISWKTSEDIRPNEPYKFVVEYYTNQLIGNKETKKLSYQFKSFADIGLVSMVFLEPLKSESFQLTPAADSHQENGYGMNMFLYQIQGMKPDVTKEFQLEYKRSETKTTMEIMEEMTGNSEHAEKAMQKNETLPMWLILTVVGGVSAIAAILLIFLMKRKKGSHPIHNKQSGEIQKDEKAKKSRLRAMLLEGSISQQEYDELLKKLGG
ncbi:hypothetical protein ACFFHH_11565 [Cytobacillus solani]|uniref:SHOCT domain-containing protein n=1 Tax=Cytobacillus solani TaxID=1637975 RepID=A0A0Q3SMQ3_9BACI|nr:hypothetical protein [Cytobacillus solani]KOP83823.1 hypothetical protein AMS60_15770 [Bacillus sp. FJAT-21945]KQL20900.1 hypothetical protein AN957_21395 [Cytobacillus solani]USK54145.1 hypothetical protein LIS82_21485 [Cytobacillus solani]